MTTRSGIVAIAGRPNVGKSTLLNALVGEKVSIVTSHPQTTRHNIRGIVTRDQLQIAFVDTPGLHERERHALNRRLNRAAASAVDDVDLNLFVVHAGVWKREDDRVLEMLVNAGHPVGLIVNKIDTVKPREALLPIIDEISRKHDFRFVVPVSALKSQNLAGIIDEVGQYLPESPFLFEPDRITDRGDHFLVTELVREQLSQRMRDELPFALNVVVEEDSVENDVRHLSAVIWVSRDSHKAIVVGKKGDQLKRAGSRVREELEERWACRVYLRLWVKVRKNWNDDDRALDAFGYEST